MGLEKEDLIVQDGSSEESNVESDEESDEASDAVRDGESDEAPDDDFGVEESDNNLGEESGDSEASENEEGDQENSYMSDENEDENDHKNDGNEASEEDEEGNVGWADAMAKVLAIGKNTDKTISVLSKAKKDNVKRKKKVKPDGDTTAGDANDSEDEEPILEPIAVRKARKKELDSIGRTRPDVLQKNAEKVLTKIATRGVVQLFNAVRVQQKDLKSKLREAGGSFRKQEKVFKNIDKDSFVDILTGGKEKPVTDLVGGPPASKKPKTEVKDEEDADAKQNSSWNILRDDFMLGAKMRDWDKDSDGE